MSLQLSKEVSTDGNDDGRSWQIAAVTAALATLVLLGWRQQVYNAMTLGYIAALLLLPVWLPAIAKYHKYAMLFMIATSALISGFVLFWVNISSHQIDDSKLVINPVLLVGTMLTVGVVLWARTLLPDVFVGLAYGAGMLLGVPGSADVDINPWKFGYSLPVIVLVLCLASLAGSRGSRSARWPELVALLLLALYSAVNDSRSLFAMLSLTGVLVLWQKMPRGRSRRKALASTVLAGTAAIIVIYELGSNLLVGGFLGVAAQQRSIAQIDSAGFLLLGGRPELAATAALFQHNPFGFGVGIVPSLEDIAVAKTGMLAINYEPNNGYVERYMFGSQFELHSVAGDLWVYFGLLGLVLAAVMAWLLVHWTLTSMVARNGSAVLLFLVVISLWNLLFSPLYSSVLVLGLALGMVALRRGRTNTGT